MCGFADQEAEHQVLDWPRFDIEQGTHVWLTGPVAAMRKTI